MFIFVHVFVHIYDCSVRVVSYLYSITWECILLEVLSLYLQIDIIFTIKDAYTVYEIVKIDIKDIHFKVEKEIKIGKRE